MKTKAQVTATFHCSLERAYKTPILGDVAQFLTGYGPVPAVVKFTDDATWGRPGGTRIPHAAPTLLAKGGPIGVDEVYVREENRYWQWGVARFLQPSMGFTEFRGEMFFEEKKPGEVHVRWVYTLSSDSLLAYPFHWFFGKVFWKGQMQRAIQKMKAYAESETGFLYQ